MNNILCAKIIAYSFLLTFVVCVLYNFRRFMIRKKYLNKECLKKYEERIQRYHFSECDGIEQSALKVGMRVEYVRTKRQAYIDKKSPNVIFVNQNLDQETKNFAISHELGHVLRGYKDTVARAEIRFFATLSAEEQICDYYSAAILLPAPEMKKRMDDGGFDDLRPDLQAEFIRKIASEKDVMEDVVNRRIIEVKMIYS